MSHTIHFKTLCALCMITLWLVTSATTASASAPQGLSLVNGRTPTLPSSVLTKTRRIKFKPGATTASVKGQLKGIHDKANFVVRAAKGQHMRVNIIASGSARGSIVAPSGEQIGGGPGGVVFDEELPQTGDYRIRVTESTMGEAWRGGFTLEVSIF